LKDEAINRSAMDVFCKFFSKVKAALITINPINPSTFPRSNSRLMPGVKAKVKRMLAVDIPNLSKTKTDNTVIRVRNKPIIEL
jgi:hypothetical protein